MKDTFLDTFELVLGWRETLRRFEKCWKGPIDTALQFHRVFQTSLKLLTGFCYDKGDFVCCAVLRMRCSVHRKASPFLKRNTKPLCHV